MPETRIPPTDDTLEQYLAGKSEVSRVYREIPMETTSAALDDRIMRAARKELRPSSARWMMPLSAVAVAVFAVSIVLNLQREDISKMLPQQRQEITPAAVPLSEQTEPEARQDMLPAAAKAAQDTDQQSALKSAPPGVITTDQSATAPDAVPRRTQETGVAPPAPIPAGEEDAGQPSANISAPSQMEEGDSERRESAPAAAMQRSASPKATDSAGSTSNSGASNTSSEATGALAGSAEKSERDEKSPEAWIEHIRNLRIAGRDKEAQAEFEAFHDRYPDYALPPDLEPGN